MILKKNQEYYFASKIQKHSDKHSLKPPILAKKRSQDRPNQKHSKTPNTTSNSKLLHPRRPKGSEYGAGAGRLEGDCVFGG